jgi:hypothetical protein
MRFSLRALMIGVTIVGLAAALAGNTYRSRHRAYSLLESHDVVIACNDEQEASTIIRRLLPREFTANVNRIKVRGEPLDGELLWAVAQFREVQEVIIADTNVTAKDCVAVAQLPNVQVVSLHGSNMETGCVAALCSSERLQNLGLSFTNTVDKDCKHIARCKSISKLNLSGTMVTDVGLRAVAALPTLSFLAISSDEVTPGGIEAVVARHPTLVIQCYGPRRFEEDWANKIERRYPNCRIQR